VSAGIGALPAAFTDTVAVTIDAAGTGAAARGGVAVEGAPADETGVAIVGVARGLASDLANKTPSECALPWWLVLLRLAPPSTTVQ